jgi:hypothetical protein
MRWYDQLQGRKIQIPIHTSRCNLLCNPLRAIEFELSEMWIWKTIHLLHERIRPWHAWNCSGLMFWIIIPSIMARKGLPIS